MAKYFSMNQIKGNVNNFFLKFMLTIILFRILVSYLLVSKNQVTLSNVLIINFQL